MNSWIAIEQAKGVLAERLGLDMDQAFSLLRTRARSQNRGLAERATAVASASENMASWARPVGPADAPHSGYAWMTALEQSRYPVEPEI